LHPVDSPQYQEIDMKLTVFYTDAMVADAASFSPSASKPAEVLKSWQALGYPLEIISPEPVSASQLHLAHDPEFVDLRRPRFFCTRIWG
jgi:hypothetical protein